MENPDYLGFGIDESTAIVVQGDDARVTGDSQVVIIRKTNKTNIQVKNGLLGSKDIRLEILLPGEKFKL